MKFLILLLILFSKLGFAEIKSIGNSDLKILLKRNIKVIDVRESYELKSTGVIERSYSVPLLNANKKFDFDEWYKRFKKIDLYKKSVIFVCAKGVRSNYISWLLKKKIPHLKIYNLKKGIDDWLSSGNKLIKY